MTDDGGPQLIHPTPPLHPAQQMALDALDNAAVPHPHREKLEPAVLTELDLPELIAGLQAVKELHTLAQRLLPLVHDLHQKYHALTARLESLENLYAERAERDAARNAGTA